MRRATITRRTRETDITVTLTLDGSGSYNIASGIGFYDHMLEQLARHALLDIDLRVSGDLHVDQHHTVEDSALALGEALQQALGEKRGIMRFGTAYAPMDETLTRCVVDISGRPYCIWKSGFSQPRLGEMDCELFPHWYASFAQAAGISLHLETLYGENNHHIAESGFKALAVALRQAIAIDPRKADAIPSTKGVL